MEKTELIFLGAGLYILIRINLKTDFDEIIKKISEKHGNNPFLVKAIIWKESGFNPKAHNTTGEDSRGLGQINAPTARALGVTNLDLLFVPDYNIEIMNKLLKQLKNRFDSIFDMIAAYNAGNVKYSAMGFYINSGYVLDVYSRYIAYMVLNI